MPVCPAGYSAYAILILARVVCKAIVLGPVHARLVIAAAARAPPFEEDPSQEKDSPPLQRVQGRLKTRCLRHLSTGRPTSITFDMSVCGTRRDTP